MTRSRRHSQTVRARVFASNHNLPTRGYVEQEFYFQGADRYNTPSLTTSTIIDSSRPCLHVC
jgi:hypothetical protein